MGDPRTEAIEIIGSVLEDAAFIFTDTLEEEAIPACDQWHPKGASLTFSGTPGGKLHMWADDRFTAYAAANMLGIEEDDPTASAKGMDALMELLNMILGNFLTRVYGEELVFDLGLPTELDAAVLSHEYESNNAIWLQAEGYPVLFVFETTA